VIALPKVLIIIGDAVEAQEIFYPYWRLKEAGVEVHVAAPSKKTIFTVVHDREPGWETYTEKPGYRFPEAWVDKAFKDVKPEEYDGLIIPGGRAPEYIRIYPELKPIIRHFFEANKPVAAICHGPLVLLALAPDHLKGRKMTAVKVLKADVEAAGATYIDEEVVVDGNLITSRTWRDLPAFMREFLKAIGA